MFSCSKSFTYQLLAVILLSVVKARAAGVNPFTDLGVAGPSHFTVLALGGASGTNLTIQGSSTVKGNIGVAPTGNLSLDTSSKDTGKAYVDVGGTIQNPGQITGGVQQNADGDKLLNNAVTAALLASSDAASMTATAVTYKIGGTTQSGKPTDILNPSGAVTFTGVSGINVVDLSDLVLSSDTNDLTLSAPVDGYFVINVSGNFSIGGGADIMLAGGLTALNVIYNATGTSGNVVFNGTNQNTVVNGILLAPNRDITLNGSYINGEVIGGGSNIYIENNASVAAPEPSTLLLMASGLGVLIKKRHKLAGCLRSASASV